MAENASLALAVEYAGGLENASAGICYVAARSGARGLGFYPGPRSSPPELPAQFLRPAALRSNPKDFRDKKIVSPSSQPGFLPNKRRRRADWDVQ
jgi:hypothetical protein